MKTVFIQPPGLLGLLWQRVTGAKATPLLAQPPARSSADGLISLSEATYNLPGVAYHGLRKDGVYVPVFIDPRGEPGEADAALELSRQEASRLRAAGYVVADSETESSV